MFGRRRELLQQRVHDVARIQFFASIAMVIGVVLLTIGYEYDFVNFANRTSVVRFGFYTLLVASIIVGVLARFVLWGNKAPVTLLSVEQKPKIHLAPVD